LSTTLVGLIIGSLLGILAGLGMWFTPRVMHLLDPIIVVLNGLPKIALGPLIVIWFGAGGMSKIVLATFATFIIALLNSAEGSSKVDSDTVSLVKSMGGSRRQIFAKVIVPSSVPWITSALRINVGMALLAVIGGEFISAKAGLGHKAAVAGNLYDLNDIWVSVILILLLAAVLNSAVSWLLRRFESIV
jgi:NitT/TauT family transport system permease protein